LLGVPNLLRRLPVQLAEVAVRLHSLDPGPVVQALSDAGMTIGEGAEQRLVAIGVAGQTDGRGFAELLDWFAAHRPAQDQRVVCHGDLHPFNLLVDSHGHVTVLDWTNADLMPREMDVAFTAGLMRCSPIAVPKAATRLLDRLSAWLADRFVTAYQQSAALDAQLLKWFEALQHARCLAEVASGRSGLSDIVGPDHPFEISAPSMIRRLTTLTGITITLPARTSGS
jgi:aminoglycoside phosphotransferase (APT) family kinase protein